MLETYAYGLISILGIFGFWLSYHIHQEKKQPKPLVCPLDFNCEKVVHSAYSKLFGIPLEVVGMLYYTLITASYGAIALYPPLASPTISLALYIVTTIGFGFSLALTAIQMVILKEFCSWCLLSATCSTAIFTILTIILTQ
ncbi:MAG: vitamin K epoxide reductase family protein [Patescibacteria group bacterium]